MNKVPAAAALVSGTSLIAIAALCTAVWVGLEKEAGWPDVAQTLGLFVLLAVVAITAIIFMGKPWVEGRQEIDKCKECPEKDE